MSDIVDRLQWLIDGDGSRDTVSEALDEIDQLRDQLARVIDTSQRKSALLDVVANALCGTPTGAEVQRLRNEVEQLPTTSTVCPTSPWDAELRRLRSGRYAEIADEPMTFDWPAGLTFVGGIAVYKALDADGDVVFIDRSAGELRIPELLGMLQLTVRRLERTYLGEER